MELRERIAAVAGTGVRDLRRAGGQHGWQHIRVTLADGREAFAKASNADTGPALEAEARGLRWLADAVAVPVPAVLGQDSHVLVLSWIPPGSADPGAAAMFGRELAKLHAAGAAGYGAPWPGFIASLPLDNTPWPASRGWAEWYAERRIEPYLRRAADAGTLGPDDVRLVEMVTRRISALAGPPSRPAASTATAGRAT